MKKRRVIVLGSTGSIGTSALDVARDLPERMEIVGLAASSSVEKLAEQVREFGVKYVAIYNPQFKEKLASLIPSDVKIYVGSEGLVELAQIEQADMVLVSIVGTAGLAPTLAAIDAGKDLAIASKEVLVMAGELVMTAAKEKGISIFPVDSEHNAIFQCLNGHLGGKDQVRRLILTASGGPFRKTPANEFRKITLEQALKHPTWSMGRKITIDSATLFNKGLEMIEARWLFDIPMEKIDVIVQPQSVVHSMVEFNDGSTLAQLSRSDMRFPIQYAVTFPDRVFNSLLPLNFEELGKLEFERPRWEDFPALNLAKWAGEESGTLPAVFNAANEVAVSEFIKGNLLFPEIWEVVETVMREHENLASPKLSEILEADSWARSKAQLLISKKFNS